ncbi:Gfo/Idh/MocA family protein [Pedomonas mirosovicensis]|uniref:Gfo/Idh/MocA family protein n=1 Tax=Pedomonas mirosovicensis TaxID=2908641 RepID=UPI002167A023|nr:Gfo/Idh/MocA family oxidoreductase [Pedomonas mirosovicensis]MCH8684171.1 Gfo/Idh/MocA family oxidoreductase [Pedomonas mirosovicensis]
MHDRNIRVGLLGLGQMGRNHLRVLSLLRGVDIAFVYDANADHAANVAAQYGVETASNLDAAVGNVDALIVCTPTATHAEYVLRFAPRVRALFVEKPLAHSLDAAHAIEKAVQGHGTFVQVGFIERFNPAVVGLERVLRDAERVISIDFTRTNRLSSRITDVDVVMDLMIHDIDLALYLNGPVKTTAAQGVVQNGLIEFASAQLIHQNGRFSRLQASRITEKKIRLIQATCDDRFVDCDLLRKEIQIHRQSVTQQSDFSAYSIASQQESVVVGQQEALLSELQTFIQAVRGKGNAPVPVLDSGISSLAIAEDIIMAISKGHA